MGKPIDQLEVELYEWPDRWLVEAEGPDRDYYQFYPDDTKETWPHFVDLSIYDAGWCSCRDFRFGVEPYLYAGIPNRCECIHIFAALRARRLRGSKPTFFKTNIKLFNDNHDPT